MRESAFFQDLEKVVKVEQSRELLLEVLRLRFGEEAVTEFQDAINRLQHLEEINDLLYPALKCRRLSQFRKAMPPG
jgi:hypothetical protein